MEAILKLLGGGTLAWRKTCEEIVKLCLVASVLVGGIDGINMDGTFAAYWPGGTHIAFQHFAF